ncbi:MAG: UDP-N-acetylmuramate--L-alanine ligase [Gammaproteobacteria bacterium]|nr:UDP-N-acetylmuramate--L-alanine ligase [Gammaproteobacteria bacterium]MCY4209480.1 UDP-N-acetylmuramate--L-alanine ligase [Gammaproteobacteria bacterium]
MPEGHNMRRVRQVHFVGIGGAGMSGIAEVLHNQGYAVTGTDLKRGSSTDRLEKLGVKVNYAHREQRVNGSDVVVYSSAVPADNPELVAARRQRIPIIPRAEMLSELMRFREGIAVAGTHGKTTTTSLIASLLAEGMFDPTYIIGGRLNMSGSHARLGKGKYIVAEADESDASFLHLSPVYAALTNIDADHLEYCGGSYQALQNNFIDFLHCLPFYGLVVICGDDAGIREISARINRPYVTYGIDSSADYRAQAIEYDGARTRFNVVQRARADTFPVTLNLPGRHNVLNALAATALATELGVSQQAISAGLENFQGIARRSSILGDIEINGKNVLLVDDYAHHPSAINAIVNAVGLGWPGRRVVVVFQPHRYTRTRDLFDEFCQVLSTLDALVLLDVYPAGEWPIRGADSRSLGRALRVRGKLEPILVSKEKELLNVLENITADNDVLLLLGAGDISALGGRLLELYQRQPAEPGAKGQ